MTIKRIKDNTIHKNENSVFLAITTNLTLNHEYEKKDTKLLLFMNRWDGKIGFPGGKVDPGENLIQALKREVLEEINFNLTIEPKLICSHNIKEKNKNVHLFHLDLPFNLVKSIMINCVDSQDFINECNGLTLTHLENYNNDKGINNYLKNNLVDSVLEETILLIKTFNKKLSNKLIKDFKIDSKSLK